MPFDNYKDEVIALTQHRKSNIRRKLGDIRITVRGHTLGFTTEATRWLVVYLDTGLQFQAQIRLPLKKMRKAEDRVRRLGRTNRLNPSLIRRIQMAAVQVVALYCAKLWWQGQKVW